MNASSSLWLIAKNEARALLGSWAACVLAAIVATLTVGSSHEVSLFALAAVATGVGAQSVGHEYAHGTLGLTLTLPVARWRQFLVKLAVLGTMLLPLAIYTSQMELLAGAPELSWLTLAAAVCLAPPLTMLCRSQVAGVILTLAVPGALITALSVAATGSLGNLSVADDRAVLALWLRLMTALLVVGAISAWWLFNRLEAIGGDVAQVELNWRTETRGGIRPTHPLWELVKKELHLQQLAIATTALFIVTAWPSALLFRPAMGDEAFMAGATISWLGLPVLIGSLAAAGERQLGTLSWQLLLPVPAWQQWAVKVAVVFGLSLLLTVGAPLPILHLFWPNGPPARVLSEIMLVIALSAGSLYISSLCSTGLRAVVASFAVLPMILWMIGWIGFALSSHSIRMQQPFGGVAVALVVAVLVGLAFVNHRTAPPSPRRIWEQ